MPTLIFVLLILAMVLLLVHAAGKLILWPAVFVVIVAEMVAHWPTPIR